VLSAQSSRACAWRGGVTVAQSAWHVSDIGRIADTLIEMAPSEDFAAGVWALARAVGAPVRLPDIAPPPVVTVEVYRDEA
jgi:hypothetical protein